jgi:hypothetical protein
MTGGAAMLDGPFQASARHLGATLAAIEAEAASSPPVALDVERWKRIEEAAARIAALSEDDVRDYEQGLCFFCGASSEPIPGPRGGVKGERRRRPIHERDCSYNAIRAALASDELATELL